MFLKRLEVFGFKSFANKVELNLEPGVTAIVGPNGSGKSNIADAIRWALGEQSARQLRGTKMEEVIFAGSSERRPLSMAEVGLTFDNVDGGLGIDYSEVTVNRRVFRSGEGEYLINKNDCRLKDLTDLFADTGVGKEGYSIIGQGQVENVLSGAGRTAAASSKRPPASSAIRTGSGTLRRSSMRPSRTWSGWPTSSPRPRPR
ncbi:MAG: AAA family ATPase [Bacillota bacterium]